MRELALTAQLSLTEKLKLKPQTNFFWLESKSDSWYNSSGSVVRTKTSGDRDSYVGEELSLQLNYDINQNLKFETAVAHFFTGAYVRDTGANDDTNWFYTQLIVKY